MTENEAIELLKNNYPKTRKMVDGRLQGGFDDHECDVGIVIDLAINALEEVQQYRAIGTPEEYPTAYDVDKVVEQLEKLKKAEQGRPDDCNEDGCGDGEQIYDDVRQVGAFRISCAMYRNTG